MAAEDFFARWSKKKSGAETDTGNVSAEIAEPVTVTGENTDPIVKSDTAVRSLPTQEDVDKLTHDSDYSAFMAQGVDESVKRSAMKKLFSDPHFNIMDGLDIYIEDYNKFEPLTPAILASLNHAKALLDPLSQLQGPLMRLLETPVKTEPIVESIPETEPRVPALDHVPANDEAIDLSDTAPADADAKKDYAEQQEQEQKESEAAKESDVTRSVDDI